MAEYTFDKIKYGNDTYKIEDSTALHSIPMASSATLGGVKIPASGNITIDANGFIDDGIDFSGPNNVSFILDDNIGVGGISISKPNGESIDTCSWNYWMDDGTSSGYGNFNIQYGLSSSLTVYDPGSTAGLATTSSNGYMSAADKTKLDSIPSGIGTTTWYGTCSTTISTSAKVVTCADFVLKTGAIIGIYFSTGNSAATPTLNINSTGAKSIYVGGSVPDSTTNVLKWSGGTVLYFMYDGSYYRYITAIASGSTAPPRGSNTWYGTSSTTASTTAKTSTIDNFVLVKGALVSVTFTHPNTADVPTLNINSTGAKAIYYNNSVTSSTNKLEWNAGETVTFIYSGSYYYFVCKSTAAVDISGKVDVTTVDDDYTSLIYNSGRDGLVLQSIDSDTEVFGEAYITFNTVTLDINYQESPISAVVLDTQGVIISSQGSSGVVIQNVVTPTNNTDAANKAYVDGLVSALTNTEIDTAVAAAVTVANGNNIQY